MAMQQSDKLNSYHVMSGMWPGNPNSCTMNEPPQFRSVTNNNKTEVNSNFT